MGPQIHRFILNCQVFSSRGNLRWAHTGETDSFSQLTEGKNCFLSPVCVFIYKLYLYWTCAGEYDVCFFFFFAALVKAVATLDSAIFGLYILI